MKSYKDFVNYQRFFPDKDGYFGEYGGAFLPPKNTIGWERGHMHCYYTFLDAVAHDLPADDNTIAEGAKLQCMMDKMLESNATGSWVEI